MPATYDKLGIRFQYPENWLLDETEAPEGELSFDEMSSGSAEGHSVSVHSPNGAFWTLVMHPERPDPARLAEAVLAAMRQEYDQLDAETVSETVAGCDLQGYDLNFFCLDLTNTSWVRAGQNDQSSFVLLCQAEDREFSKVRPVFEAMTASLLSGW